MLLGRVSQLRNIRLRGEVEKGGYYFEDAEISALEARSPHIADSLWHIVGPCAVG